MMIYLAAMLAGVFFWNTMAGKYEGDRLERSWRIPLGRFYLHIHHWLYCLVLMVSLQALDLSCPGVDGFLAGSVLQGFTYRDWYLLYYEQDQAATIYAGWHLLDLPASGFDGS